MDLQQILQFYYNIPPITRYYQTLSVLTTLLVQFGVFTPFDLYFNTSLILWRGQVWRLLSSFFFFGTLGFNFMFNMIFMFKYSQMLEEVSFHNRTADFVYMFLFGTVFILLNATILHVTFLSQPLTVMLVYIWCRRNPHSIMSFFGILNFHAPYLPWVLVGFGILLGNHVGGDIVGVCAGHTYYFFEDVLPTLYSDLRVLRTPKFLKRLIEGSEPEQPIDPNYQPLPEVRPGGFDWED